MWVYGLDWAGSGQRQLAEACECGNEPSGSVKCGEFLDQLLTSQLLKKDSAPWRKYYYMIIHLLSQLIPNALCTMHYALCTMYLAVTAVNKSRTQYVR